MIDEHESFHSSGFDVSEDVSETSVSDEHTKERILSIYHMDTQREEVNI
jgi:hypothetical protein